MVRSLCKHLYNPARLYYKKRSDAPKWFRDLAGGVGMISPTAAPSPSPKPATSERASGFDWQSGRAWRTSSANKKSCDWTDDIYPSKDMPEAFMMARWPDGETIELLLTVHDWRSRGTQACNAKTKLSVWKGSANDGTTVEVKKKQLDRDNPGIIVAVGGSQKAQLSFHIWSESEATDQCIEWARKLAEGKITETAMKAE